LRAYTAVEKILGIHDDRQSTTWKIHDVVFSKSIDKGLNSLRDFSLKCCYSHYLAVTVQKRSRGSMSK